MNLNRLTTMVLRRYLLGLPQYQRLLRYQALTDMGWGWLKPALTEIKPEVIPDPPPSLPASDIPPEVIQSPTPYYRQYRCTQGDPLSCHGQSGQSDQKPCDPKQSEQKQGQSDRSQPSATMACVQCYFPLWLKPEQQLNGKQGQYKITQSLGRRGLGRLYKGIQLDTEDPVTIQEYLLPERYFNADDQRQCQDRFVHLTGLALADGRSQDMRIVPPLDAIADPGGERCYVVSSAIDQTSTLNHYCARHGSFNGSMVRDLLNQALQTLIFLHQQIFTLPSGQIQRGIIHGNISLDSLLWQATDHHRSPQGFLYFTDFDLWENLFDPTMADRDDLGTQDDLMAQDDLTALGKVAFWALNGATVDQHGDPLNPRSDSDWPSSPHPSLQHFIRRLMGIESPFDNAEVARLALFQLPPDPVISQWEERPEERIPVKKSGLTHWLRRALPIVAIALIIAALGSLGWFFVRSRQQALQAKPLLSPCCFKDAGIIPKGTYIYTSPTSAYWQSLFQTPPNSSFSADNINPSFSTVPSNTGAFVPPSAGLFNQIEALQADLSLVNQPTDSVSEAIAAVQTGQADFAILPLIHPLPPDVAAITVAYDSLVPVVAFSYVKRTEGLPHALKGRIRLQHLQSLYTSNTANWRQFSAIQLPVEPYLPDDKISQELIQWLVFDQSPVAGSSTLSTPSTPSANTALGESQSLQSSQEPFTAPAVSGGEPNNSSLIAQGNLPPNTTLLPILTMLRQILQDFENETVGSIGIAPLSQVFGQCSVYPLALEDHRQFVNPLIFDNGDAITPASDLCDRKGSYSPHSEAIRDGTYPLAYPLAIVYPFDNTRSDVGKLLAELLLSQESQRYFQSFGLVSAYSLPFHTTEGRN